MTWETPWVISGVEEVPLETARVMAYVATGGETGVVTPTSLKITATAAPSNQIETAAGSFVAASSFLNVFGESYIGRNTSTVLTNVPNTGGVARYDFVYAHVIDPGQAGQPAVAGPVETRVVTNVSSTATTMADVPALAGQTGVPLARIYRGPSSTTVTQANITDLRVMIKPRSLNVGRSYMVPTNVTFNNLSFVTAPSGASWSIDIPTWATRISWGITQGNPPILTDDSPSPTIYEARLKLGVSTALTSQVVTMDYSDTAMGGYGLGLSFVEEATLPPLLRGTTTTLAIQMRRVMGETGTFYAGNPYVVQVQFSESASDA